MKKFRIENFLIFFLKTPRNWRIFGEGGGDLSPKSPPGYAPDWGHKFGSWKRTNWWTIQLIIKATHFSQNSRAWPQFCGIVKSKCFRNTTINVNFSFIEAKILWWWHIFEEYFFFLYPFTNLKGRPFNRVQKAGHHQM